MGDTAVVVIVAAVVVLVSLGAALAVQRPLQRRWFRGTGFEEWRATARRLPWRDRVRLERANSRGRAASPALADLAARRGRVMMAIIERMQTGRRSRWLYRIMAVFGAVLFLANLVLVLAGGGNGSTWFTVVVWGLVTPMYAAMPRFQRRQWRRIRRSVDLNAATARGDATSSG